MSNVLRNATYSVHKLVKQADNLHSLKTRANTKSILTTCMTALHEMGYKLPNIEGLKQKHVETLLNHWKAKELNPATIKNYMAKLRWACDAMNKPNVIKVSNEAYNIGARSYIASSNKAIHELDLSKITNANIKLSLEAQRLFGLRREESLKLVVSEADKGDHLFLKGSWTKGGIERNIPILTQEQREFLNKLHEVIPEKQSLIPKDKTNKEQIKLYENQAREAGFKNLHGLRHAYAQTRYATIVNELTHGNGWRCPREGGLLKSEMSKEQKMIDLQARGMLTKELGHSRIGIVKIYIN